MGWAHWVHLPHRQWWLPHWGLRAPKSQLLMRFTRCKASLMKVPSNPANKRLVTWSPNCYFLSTTKTVEDKSPQQPTRHLFPL